MVKLRRTLAAFAAAALLDCMIASGGMAQEPVQLAASQQPGRAIALGAGPTEVMIAPVRQASDRGAASLASRLRALPPATPVYLQLLGARSEQAPGVTYNVYLNLPAGSAGQGAADPHYVGTFSFFDAEVPRNLAINVTDHLKRMNAAGLIDAGARVTIVPAGAPSRDAKPEIAKITVIAQ